MLRQQVLPMSILQVPYSCKMAQMEQQMTAMRAEMNATMAPGHEVKIAGILEESGDSNAALGATLPVVLGLTFFLLTPCLK